LEQRRRRRRCRLCTRVVSQFACFLLAASPPLPATFLLALACGQVACAATSQRTCGARGGATTCGAPGGTGEGGAGDGGGDGTSGQAAPTVALKPQFVRAKLAKKPTPSGPTAATTAVTTSG
jgi:hypothetical protein